jgi:hypothetical protein
MVFLQSHGVSTTFDIFGIGFKTADKIARSPASSASPPALSGARPSGRPARPRRALERGPGFYPRPQLIEAPSSRLRSARRGWPGGRDPHLGQRWPGPGRRGRLPLVAAPGRERSGGDRPGSSSRSTPPHHHRHREGDHLVRGAAEDLARSRTAGGHPAGPDRLRLLRRLVIYERAARAVACPAPGLTSAQQPRSDWRKPG